MLYFINVTSLFRKEKYLTLMIRIDQWSKIIRTCGVFIAMLVLTFCSAPPVADTGGVHPAGIYPGAGLRINREEVITVAA